MVSSDDYVMVVVSIRPMSHQDQFIQVLTHIIVSEYDQEIPQSQAADNLVVPRERATQQSRDTRKTN